MCFMESYVFLFLMILIEKNLHPQLKNDQIFKKVCLQISFLCLKLR